MKISHQFTTCFWNLLETNVSSITLSWLTGSAQLRLDWQDPSAMGLSVKEIEAMTSFNLEVVIVGCSDENLEQMLSKCWLIGSEDVWRLWDHIGPYLTIQDNAVDNDQPLAGGCSAPRQRLWSQCQLLVISGNSKMVGTYFCITFWYFLWLFKIGPSNFAQHAIKECKRWLWDAMSQNPRSLSTL